MIALISYLNKQIAVERKRAEDKGHGHTFGSNHEAYAVILEEYEETEEEHTLFEKKFIEVWREKIRQDEDAYDGFIALRDIALRASAEWLQVAAMCEKASDSENERRKK